ncbi:MAG TPA: hypothetical protein VK540_25475 [Polyangiaceae bacterium]|nr:hypothetical protein [Polyangiaceae bacterium]
MSCAVAACDPTIILGARDLDAAPERPDGREDLDVRADFDGRADPDGRADFDGRVQPDGRVDFDVRADFDGRVEPDGRVVPDAQMDLDARSDGARPTILWSADHETGNLSAWHMGGDTQGGEYAIGGSGDVSRDRAHGGSSYSVKLTIDTTDGLDHLTRLYRRTVSGGAYYSVWFYWNQAHTPTAWWSVMLFRAQTDPADPNTVVNLWDIEASRQMDGQMTLRFLDHLTNKITYPLPAKALPVGQWVQVEAFFQYAPPSGTRVTVWQDGDPIFDVAGLGQSPSSYLFWAVGNGSNGLTPPLSTIYIDDAAIATGRLGPAADL